jgi:hypothetical protein
MTVSTHDYCLAGRAFLEASIGLCDMVRELSKAGCISDFQREKIEGIIANICRFWDVQKRQHEELCSASSLLRDKQDAQSGKQLRMPSATSID